MSSSNGNKRRPAGTQEHLRSEDRIGKANSGEDRSHKHHPIAELQQQSGLDHTENTKPSAERRPQQSPVGSGGNFQQEYQILLDKNKAQDKMISRLKEELEKTATSLGSIQKALLSSSDRFQPAFDEEICGHFKELDSSANTLIMFLGGLSTLETQIREWPERALWRGCINFDIGPMPFKEKRDRRKVTTVVVWKFLDDYIFKRGFECFDGTLPPDLNGIYERLFREGNPPYNKEETEAAVRWRAATAAQLKAIGRASTTSDNNLCEELRAVLEHFLIEDLGYPAKSEELAEKQINQMLKKALSFARLLIEQRAIFKLLIPDLKEYGYTKEENDPFRDNTGSNLCEIDDEVKGPVWFLIRPGLVKLGTGQGSKLDQKMVLRKAVVELALE